MEVLGPSSQFRLTRAMFKGDVSKISGILRYGGTEQSCPTSSLSGLSTKSKHGPWQLSLHCHLMDGVHPLRFMWWGHQDGWGYCWGLCRGTVGCGAWAWAVDFLASLAVWTCCILYQDCGLYLCSAKEPLSLSDGLSCSFTWGGLPWACIHPICIPEEALLFLLLPAPFLPFWPAVSAP